MMIQFAGVWVNPAHIAAIESVLSGQMEPSGTGGTINRPESVIHLVGGTHLRVPIRPEQVIAWIEEVAQIPVSTFRH